MNFFNFGQQTEEDRQVDMDLSNESIEPSVCLDLEQVKNLKEIEVNSRISSMVQLDDSNDDAESIANLDSVAVLKPGNSSKKLKAKDSQVMNA